MVNLELIGHSEGTVVNTYALATLQQEMTPQLESGFIEDTLLDPHAANNDVISGKQMSFAGPLAGLAEMVVSNYQGEAKDPPPYFPSIVNEANVFFEHTQATAGGIYNLWGQVPVKSEGPPVHYYNLTDDGSDPLGQDRRELLVPRFHRTHAGRPGPAGAATPVKRTDRRRAGIDVGLVGRADRVGVPTQVVTTAQPEFSGTAAPGSVVRLLLSPADKPSAIGLAGVTHADASGDWSLTTRRPLPGGNIAPS